MLVKVRWLLMVLPFVLWGTAMAAMRPLLDGATPLQVASLRLLPAGGLVLLAALLLGIADVAGKYYIPKMGAFIVYTLMIVILIWRPQGLFVRQGAKS